MLNASQVAAGGGRWNSEWENITSDEAVQQWALCFDSFSYFVNTFVYIQDKKSKAWIPFELWAAQEDAADLMQHGGNLIILKTRQVGLSWLLAAYAVWAMLFEPISTILVFSKGLREAIDLRKRVRDIYEKLPAFLKCKSIIIDRKTEFLLSNGSRCVVLPASAGDSYSATHIFFDEADHVEKFDELFNRASPAAEGGGRIFINSTSDKNLPNSMFKRLFKGATAGANGYTPIFIPYTAHPDRDDAWYRNKRAELFEINGTHDEMEAKYPRTPKEALSGISLNKFFPIKWIDRAFDEVEPAYIITDGYEDRIPENAPAVPNLIVYEPPIPGAEYIIGIDGAEGGANSHDTAITVMDYHSMIEVAHLSGLIDATTTGVYAVELHHYYNAARIMPERNNHGHSIIAEILSAGVEVQTGLDGKHGWLTNTVGKTRMYNWAFKVFNQFAAVVRTEKTKIQLQDIERATLKAPPNTGDDCSDSYVIAIAGIMHLEGNRATGDYLSDEEL